MYKTNAIGLVTKTAGWTNPDWNFVVGYAGGDWTRRTDGQYVQEPNTNLKPIELQTRSEGKPFFALWDFDVSYYSNQQYMATEDKWPNLDMDYPYQACKNALAARDFDGLIIRVMDRHNDFTNKTEMMSYVSFAANKFINRINTWLYTTKGLNKQTLVLTCDPFVKQDGAQEYYYSWIRADFPPLVVEQAAVVLDSSYPVETEKPGAVGNANWKMWYYWWPSRTKNWVTEPALINRASGIMLFNGDEVSLKNWLGIAIDPVDPGDDGTGDGDNTGGTVDLSEYMKIADFEAYQQLTKITLDGLKSELDNLRNSYIQNTIDEIGRKLTS